MRLNRILMLLLVGTALFFVLAFSASAQETVAFAVTPSFPRLTDGKENAAQSGVSEVVLSSETLMESLYLIYYEEPVDVVLKTPTASVTVRGEFLSQWIDLVYYFGEGQKNISLEFVSEASLLEIYAFGNEVPEWVQRWENPSEKADLCLMSTHSDDEQLFFAGILPYYAGQMKYEVQVIYLTDHRDTPLRRHELLKGLWTVGVTRYPVISSFPDQYSESEAQAEANFARKGIRRDDVLGFQVEMLRRFSPLVVIGHDPKGEYGHGQHRLNSSTLQEAVKIAGDPAVFPESAERYGVWEVPKTYLHLWEENQIQMNWDEPLSAFDGKTAFQMTKEGFQCHKSQHDTWFYAWLNGSRGEISLASQIRTYSPCQYGLYLSRVGEDVLKNDFFENLKVRRVQAEEKAESAFAELLAAREEKIKQEKEEEERKKKEAEEKKLLMQKEAEERRLREAEEAKRRRIVLFSAFVVSVLAAAFLFFFKKRKAMKKKAI